jgi:hypothetical protein
LFGPPDVDALLDRGNVRGLIRALSYKKDARVRQKAAGALGEIDDDAVNVQNNAAEALVKIGGPEVIGRFIGMMFHARGSRKQAIGSALRQITGEDFGTNSYGWQEWLKGQRKG